MATATEEWHTQPGWYWRTINLNTGEIVDGPCTTDGECRVEAERAKGRPAPEEITA